LRTIFKILLWHYQRKIPLNTDTVDTMGNFYSRQLSGIIDCLQYIVDVLEGDDAA